MNLSMSPQVKSKGFGAHGGNTSTGGGNNVN
eukprot:CAMPEP_0116878934 /NCGR_PEP_ID=MMETSP0463-20121206/10685_1 /TAXON_ID=181622 /ORGANISM="Strombidinopsis sp, Strain SopsisLIS2011" /LENGTH=30 /DNA_ID= /DNA_START= /DNA_END= /DNA_ORIENTATION=